MESVAGMFGRSLRVPLAVAVQLWRKRRGFARDEELGPYAGMHDDPGVNELVKEGELGVTCPFPSPAGYSLLLLLLNIHLPAQVRRRSYTRGFF